MVRAGADGPPPPGRLRPRGATGRRRLPAPGHPSRRRRPGPHAVHRAGFGVRAAPGQPGDGPARGGAWRPPPVQRWELPAAPAEARVCCPDGRFHPCQEHDPEGYATWAEEGMATAADPDPDYGRDLDDDDAEPGR